jgi:calcium-dependent protein kinase
LESLLRAINHCHENGICHRDIKPENILFGAYNDIKIIDFGLSKFRSNNMKNLYTKVGSPYFVAPEVLT